MMTKNTKIILTISTILMIFLLGVKLTNNKKTIVYLDQETISHEEIEIISNSNYIKILPKINEITNISWKENNIIEFNGINDNGQRLKLLFDIDTKALLSKKEKVKNSKDESGKSLVFFRKIDDVRSIIYRKEKGLFYINNKKEKKLADSIEYKDETKIKFTNDLSKIAFYNSAVGVLMIYNTKNNTLKSIDIELTNYTLENFDDSLHFSHDKGYLIIEHINYENINESYFSVVGSDTGKVYGDKIYGVNPQWANESLYISFIYSESNIDIYKYNKNSLIAGNRVGIFNLKNRSIKYTEAINKPFKIIGNTLWGKGDNEVYILIGKEQSNNYIPYSIYTFSIKNNTLVDLNYKIDNYFHNGNILIDEIDNYLFLSDKAGGNLVCINLINRSITPFEGLQEYSMSHLESIESNLFTYLFDNTFIFIRDNGIYIYNKDSIKNVYKKDSKIENIVVSPSKDKGLVMNSFNNRTELTIIQFKK